MSRDAWRWFPNVQTYGAGVIEYLNTFVEENLTK
jgi:hypothetical protein